MKKTILLIFLAISIIGFSAVVSDTTEEKRIINEEISQKFKDPNIFDGIRNANLNAKEKEIIKNFYYAVAIESMKDQLVGINYTQSIKKYQDLGRAQDTNGKYEDLALTLFYYEGVLSNASLEINNSKLMLKQLEKLQKEYPFLTAATFMKPNIYVVIDENYDEAIKLYNNMETNYPIPEFKELYQFMAHSGKSMIYMYTGNYEQSLDEFEKMVKNSNYFKGDDLMLQSYMYTKLYKKDQKLAAKYHDRLQKIGYNLELYSDNEVEGIEQAMKLARKPTK